MSRHNNAEPVEIDVELVHPTPLAWKVRDVKGNEAWLAKSQVTFPDRAKAGDAVTLEVPEWIADESGLEW